MKVSADALLEISEVKADAWLWKASSLSNSSMEFLKLEKRSFSSPKPRKLSPAYRNFRQFTKFFSPQLAESYIKVKLFPTRTLCSTRYMGSVYVHVLVYISWLYFSIFKTFLSHTFKCTHEFIKIYLTSSQVLIRNAFKRRQDVGFGTGGAFWSD